MRLLIPLLAVLAVTAPVRAQDVKRDIPYADPAHERQVLGVYSPKEAKGLPVVFWIHGGGWQAGDKKDVQLKPQAFMDKGFVFVGSVLIWQNFPKAHQPTRPSRTAPNTPSA